MYYMRNLLQGFATPRPYGVSRGEVTAYFLIAALLDVIIGLGQPSVLQGYLSDPDTLMRLVRLRDILAQHAPLHTVLRDNSGDGTIVHWSHLLDSLLLILATPLRLSMDWDQALHAVATVFGPISVGLLGVATAWAMAPLAARDWRWTAPVLVAVSPTIVAYGLPGVADHHVLLALGAVMMAGAAGRVSVGDAAAGLTLGVWSAAGIWLSPEAMPFAVVAFGGAGFAWLLRPRQPSISRGIASAATAFLLLTTAAFVVDPPAGGHSSATIEANSVVFVLLAAVVCAIAWWLLTLDRLELSPVRRRVLGGGIACVGLLLWLALFPVVLRGPDALADTPEARTMYAEIQEMLPVTSLAGLVTQLLDGAGAALALAWLAIRDRRIGWRSVLWTYTALAVVGLEVLGQSHVRFTTYSSAAAATVLPIVLTECTRLLSERSLRTQSTVRIAVVAVMLLATRAEAFANLSDKMKQESPRLGPSCSLQEMAQALRSWAGEIVLTDIGDVPGLLYSTKIRTVGSLYRNADGFSRLRAAWRTPPSDVEPEAVRRTRAALVLYCKYDGRSGLVADLPEETLWDRLGRGEVPAWLEPVPADSRIVQLYRIVNPAQD
jgi:hypothetical protein